MLRGGGVGVGGAITFLGTCIHVAMLDVWGVGGGAKKCLGTRSTCSTHLMLRSELSQVTSSTYLMLRSELSQVTSSTYLILRSKLSQVSSRFF